MSRVVIFAEIAQERTAQDEQWGGKAHDDSHERFEWLDWIHKQERLAFDVFYKPADFERRMVKIAALAIAAIESSRRQRGVSPENGKVSAPTISPEATPEAKPEEVSPKGDEQSEAGEGGRE